MIVAIRRFYSIGCKHPAKFFDSSHRNSKWVKEIPLNSMGMPLNWRKVTSNWRKVTSNWRGLGYEKWYMLGIRQDPHSKVENSFCPQRPGVCTVLSAVSYTFDYKHPPRLGDSSHRNSKSTKARLLD